MKKKQPPCSPDIPPSPWDSRLDTTGAVFGALLPIGLVIGSTGFELAMGIGILCWLMRSLLTGKESFRRTFSHPLFLPLAAWYASILISLAWNGAGSKGWAHDVAILRFGLFVLAMLDISRRKPVVTWMIWGLAAGVGLAAVNLITACLLGYDFIGNPLSRYTHKLKEAARIAATTAYAVPFFLWWGISGKELGGKKRALILALGIAAFAHLLQSRIRTAMLATACGMGFLIYRRFRNRIPLWATLSAVAGLLAVAAWILVANYHALNLLSMYDRIYYWKVSLVMWQHHPFVGVGISAWMDAYKELAQSGAVSAFTAPDSTVWQTQKVYHAHNLPLMLLSSTGLLGAAAFTWLFARATKLALSNQTGFRAGMVAWPIVFITIGLTGFSIYSSSYLSLLAFLLVMTGSTETS